MANLIKTKRGLDIEISGKAKDAVGSAMPSEVIAMVPDHYHGVIPKVMVKPGDKVKAGTPVFHDKTFENMNFASPVSGEIIAVNRGDRRKVLSITIAREDKIEYEKFDVKPADQLSGEEVKTLLLQAGLWPYIKQRPYDVIANPNHAPKAIFISSFDSAPLAPNNEFVMRGQFDDFQAGINALSKLTEGKIHLGIRAGSKSTDFRMVHGVEITEYQGAHPIGNVGVQINHIDPVNKGEVVWIIGAQDVLFLGRFFNKGIVDLSRLVALTGPEVVETQYYRTLPGASIEPIVRGNVQTGIPLRYISGNVLSGLQIAADGAIDPYATQITVLDEGSETHELVGWAMPRFDRFSNTNLYFSKILKNPLVEKAFGKVNFKWDSRLMGGRRGIIMSNEYDKVLPMDILPEFLIKAMMAQNIDKMENLGAYEVAPEDFALCEFVDTSKLPLQAIVREALDYMKSEVE
ncbi:Na(+)-translocating NADH-quinone reductase subunit A [Paludibacter sp. 221]|uniref:Na(+)-translocating NADH-quinone reductase subunit A n=1 Tax=Paludibacter sp. 221 TaxID=2302939 RepID=UPI0013D61D58|nr:Na(+)-translocating NADH-quinone reductase subunit A [Paludibacter sp. 221]NDV45645.1 Na(+)-translocating NADH-quinone reductase subunit A [Paludibacter sp. 221]